MRALTSSLWLLALFCVGPVLIASGQVATSTPPVDGQATPKLTVVQAYQAEQLTLVEQERTLVANGATPQQIQVWQRQNAAAFALQQKRVQAGIMASELKMQVANGEARIPANASPTLKDYLTTQAALAKVHANLHNQMVQQAAASGQNLTFSQLRELRQNEEKEFQQQNAALLSLQQQRLQTLASESARVIRLVPSPVVIPAGTTPQAAADLTTRREIMQTMIQVENQYATADPKVRAAAMHAWFKQNAEKMAQLQAQPHLSSNTAPPIAN